MDEDLESAGTYSSAAEGSERGLVVLSMGLPYWLVQAPEGYRLLVDAQVAGRVREELSHFESESVGWPPKPLAEPETNWARSIVTPLLWAIAVIAVFHAQNAPSGNWEDRGDMNAWAVFHRGELWRPVTALFLHWDLGHLVSNLIAGVFIFTSLVSVMGILRGWLFVLAAAVAGNLLVGAVHYPAPYRSLGASTAIFAALGLLTGRAVRRVFLSGRLREWRPVFIPLASGVALLGIFGAGGANTDIAAHASGFAMGLVIGFAASGRAELAGTSPAS